MLLKSILIVKRLLFGLALIVSFVADGKAADISHEFEGLNIDLEIVGGGTVIFDRIYEGDGHPAYIYKAEMKDGAFFPITSGNADLNFMVGGRDVIDVRACVVDTWEWWVWGSDYSCNTIIYNGELFTDIGQDTGHGAAEFYILPGQQIWAEFDIGGSDRVCWYEGHEYICEETPNSATGFSIRIEIDRDTFQGPAGKPETKGGPDDNMNTYHEGGDGPGQCGGGLPDYWVNTSTLALAVVDTDFHYEAFGPGMAMTRTWNADPREVGMFGRGWNFSYESRIKALKADNGFARIIRGSGQEVHYGQVSRTTSEGLTTTTYTPHTSGSNGDILTGYESGDGDYYIFKQKAQNLFYRYDYTVVGSDGLDNYILSSISDRNGRSVSITYNLDDTISYITDAAGRETTFTYNTSGRCVRMITPYGHHATYSYDANDNLIESMDLVGAVTTYTYDSNNYITAIVVDDKAASFTYNTEGGWRHISSFTNAVGETTTYSIEDNGDIVSTDSAGGMTTYSTAFNSGTTSRINPAGDTATYDYSGKGYLTRASDDATSSSYEYDERGNLITYTDGTNNSWSITYDGNDNPLTVTNPLGQATAYAWSEKGIITSITTQEGAVTGYEYDDNGLLKKVVDPTGNEFTYGYNAFGNMVTSTDPLGNTNTFTYDSQGIRLQSTTDPLGNTTTYDYDNNGRVWRITHPDESTNEIVYDHCAATRFVDPTGQATALTRDKVLAITQASDSLNHAWAYSYDSQGLLTSITDPLEKTIGYSYDASGRLIKVTNPLGNEVTYAWNGSVLTELTDELGRKNTFGYDNNGRLTTLGFPEVMTSPPGGFGPPFPMQTYLYWTRDEMGRVSRESNGRSNAIDYTYDSEGRLLTRSHNSSLEATFTYDLGGRLTMLVDSSGTTTFTWNALSQVSSITYPSGLVLSLTHDEKGNLSALTYPGGFVVSYTYNSRNWPTRVTWTGGGWVNLSYDQAGRITHMDRSNETTTVLGHDGAKRIAQITHNTDDAPFAGIVYNRDAAGHITAMDVLSSVTPEMVPANDVFTYNEANQIKSAAGEACGLDGDGNLTAWGNRFSAVYDARNIPSQVTLGGVTTNYLYNGMGWRWEISSNGIIRRHHYDHRGRLLFMADNAGDVAERYIYLGGLLVAWNRANGDFFFHGDQNGNVLSITDEAGQETSAYAYDPYGKITASRGDQDNPFTFVGQFGVMHDGDGLYYMRNRYYLAGLHRFLQRDPIGFGGGQTNLYAYAGNNPVNWIDPSGLKRQQPKHFKYIIGPNGEQSRPVLGGRDKTWDYTIDYFIEGFSGQYKENLNNDPVFSEGDRALTYINPAYSLFSAYQKICVGDYQGAFETGSGAIPVIGTYFSLWADTTRTFANVYYGNTPFDSSVPGQNFHNPSPTMDMGVFQMPYPRLER